MKLIDHVYRILNAYPETKPVDVWRICLKTYGICKLSTISGYCSRWKKLHRNLYR